MNPGGREQGSGAQRHKQQNPMLFLKFRILTGFRFIILVLLSFKSPVICRICCVGLCKLRKIKALGAKFAGFVRPIPNWNSCCHPIPKEVLAAAGGTGGLVLALLTREATGYQTSSSTIPITLTAAGFSFAFCWV